MKIGELVIGLRADVAQIQRDMSDAKSSVQGAMKDIETYAGYAKTALEALGVATTAIGFKNAIDGAIEFKARLFDLSSQTGIGVSALGALASVGKETKTSLDDIATASAKLSKAVETQNEDSKGAAQAIAALGLNFDKFKQLKPDEQLLAVSKAMAGFEDGTGKTAAAMLLFGKTGATLLPFLRDLADKTDLVSAQTLESAKQAKQYEKNLDDLRRQGDALKRQLAEALLPTLIDITRALVDFRSEGSQTSTILDGFKVVLQTVTVLGANVAFVFQGVGREIGAWAAQFAALAHGDLAGFHAISDAVKADGVKARAELDEFEKRVLGLAGGSAAGAGRGFVNPDNVVPTRPKITGLDEGTAKSRDLYAELVKTVNERIAQQQMEADKGRQLTDIEKLQAKAYDDIDKGVIKANLSQKLYIDGLFQIALEEEKLAKEREQSRKENDAALETADKQREALLGQNKALEQQLEEFGKTYEELQALSIARDMDTAALLRARAATMDTVGAMGQLRQVYLDQAAALDLIAGKKVKIAELEANERNNPMAGADRAVKNYLSDIKRAGDATEAAIGNSLRSLEDTLVVTLRGGDIKNAWKSLIDQMLSEATRLLIIRPLLQSVLTNGGGPGSQYSGGWMSLIGAAVGAFTGSGYSFNGGVGTTNAAGISGGRAGGGSVDAFKSYVVGEKGPEILRMGSSGGTVVPNGGGAQITYAPVIHIDARADEGAVAQQTAAAVQQGNRQMVELLRSRGVL